jgi:hypothetical protein
MLEYSKVFNYIILFNELNIYQGKKKEEQMIRSYAWFTIFNEL